MRVKILSTAACNLITTTSLDDNTTKHNNVKTQSTRTMARDSAKAKNYEEKSSDESNNGAESDSEGSGVKRTAGYVIPKKTVPATATKKNDIDPQTPTKELGKSPSKMRPSQSTAKAPASTMQALQKPMQTANKGSPSQKQPAIASAKKRAQGSANSEETVAKKKKVERRVQSLLHISDEEEGSNNEEDDDANSLGDDLSVEELIEKAEQGVAAVVEYLWEAPFEEKQINEYKNVSRYLTRVLRIHKIDDEEEQSKSKSPIWSHTNVEINKASSLQMLQGVQAMNIYIADVLYANSKMQDDEVHPDTKMLATYMCKFGIMAVVVAKRVYSLQLLLCLGYQLRENKKDVIDFNQDLEVMEKLIANNPLESSIKDIFGHIIPAWNEGYLEENWADLNKADDLTIKRSKNFCYKDDNGKIGAQLLLLLAYMMVSSVWTDKSMALQM